MCICTSIEKHLILLFTRRLIYTLPFVDSVVLGSKSYVHAIYLSDYRKVYMVFSLFTAAMLVSIFFGIKLYFCENNFCCF